MATLYDVPVDALIEYVADRITDDLEEPDWIRFAKTGESRELPPQQEDFWQTRAASLLRKVAVDGPVGVDRLSTEYGGRKRGSTRYVVSSESSVAGSKKIVRVCLQQLEEADYVETAEGEGRRVTGEGRRLLDDVADDVLEDLDRPDLERYA
jgi:small subunit ribosomal protein S19e